VIFSAASIQAIASIARITGQRPPSSPPVRAARSVLVIGTT